MNDDQIDAVAEKIAADAATVVDNPDDAVGVLLQATILALFSSTAPIASLAALKRAVADIPAQKLIGATENVAANENLLDHTGLLLLLGRLATQHSESPVRAANALIASAGAIFVDRFSSRQDIALDLFDMNVARVRRDMIAQYHAQGDRT